MADLSLRGFSDLVRQQSAAVQAAMPRLVDLRPGSMLRAVLEATAGVALWLQLQALQILAATRLGTSTGSDVDTFVVDYGLERLVAIPAKGQVVFSRSSATATATIPVGTLVRTGDTSRLYGVSIDDQHAYWAADIGIEGGYLIPAGVAAASLPVVALVGGADGNVDGGAISLLSSGVSGIDSVINLLATSEGQDEETDEALKARFPAYLDGLAKATRAAIEAAIAGTQQGLSWYIAVNQDETGRWAPGNFVVTIDDGSGATPPETIAKTYAAVDAVKALAERFSVHAASTATVDVAVVLVLRPGSSESSVRFLVRNAIAQLLTDCGIGDPVPFSAIAAACHGASPNVLRVSQILINGIAQTDFITAPTAVVRPGTVTVS